jgi:hypothetical protein
MFTIDQPPIDEFIEFAWRINASDPGWIPPLRARLHQELAGADAFGRYARFRLFGCRTSAGWVGRLAAIANPRLKDPGGHILGQIGYFEAIDDSQVAANLFGAAFDWLRSQGAREVYGPMNGGAHRLHRLMTAGFDQEPFLFEPRNPPYYPRLFESFGFGRAYSWYSIDATRDQLQRALETLAMLRVTDSARRRYEVMMLDPADAATVLPRLHRLLDAMWIGHKGYGSIDLQEFAEIFAPALSLMTRENLYIAVERNSDRDVGFAFTYPDYAAEVRALNGDARGWGVWRQTGAHPERSVLSTMGLAREARGRGIAMWFVRNVIEDCVRRYAKGVIALVIEDLRALKKIAPPTREYVLLGRGID